jgi:hypothetical protein
MAAYIAADSFDLSIKLASQQNKAQYTKFFNRGVQEFQKLSGSLHKGGAVVNMHGWLAAALAHSKSTSDKHFARTETQQAQYDVGARGAARVQENIHREQAGLPPVPAKPGPSFAQIASGLATIITPLAQAGTQAYVAGQRGGAPAAPTASYMAPPPAAKSNTGLYIGLAVVAVVGIGAIVVLSGNKPAPAAARKRKKRKR